MNIVFIIIGAFALYGALMLSGFHQVREGYVGLYKYFGVLQTSITNPGIHFRIPFYQEYIEMKISIQTDVVTNIPCGTSNGTMIAFNKIEVVNKLKKQHVYGTVLNYTQDYEKFWVTDKVHHEINQLCSKNSLQQLYIDIFDTLDEQLVKALNRDIVDWAPGIQILSVRVTKPTIPERIKGNFQEMQRMKNQYYIAVEKEKVKVEEELTKQKQLIIKEQSNYDVKIIDLKKGIEKKENEKKMAVIEADMIFDRERTKIDTEFLPLIEEAVLYKDLYSDEYLKFLSTDAYTKNLQITVGNKIPNTVLGKI